MFFPYANFVRSVEFWLQKETSEDFIKDVIILKYIFKKKKKDLVKKIVLFALNFVFLNHFTEA